MAWLSSNSWATSAAMTAAALNNLANDVRAWGGDVNGGGFALANAKIEFIGGSAAAPGLRVSGDANTGVFSSAADEIGLATGGSMRFRVNSSGQIGINNVGGYFGRVSIEDSSAPNAGYYLFSGANGDNYYTCGAAGFHLFRANNVNKMVIANSGLVGIGVDTPLAGVHVVGHVSNEVARFVARVDSSNNRAFVSLFSTNPAFWWELSQQDAAGGGTSNGLAFRERSGSGASVERIFVAPGGNFGINKLTPNTKLAVAGLPSHVDNAAATTAGLTAGDFYRTAAGVVMVVF